MGKIKIYSDLKSGKVTFDGASVQDKDIGSLEAVEHPSISNRIIVRSTRQYKSGSNSEFRVFFKKLNINRIENKDGQQLTAAPLLYDRAQVLEYLLTQFTKPQVQEYFEYDAALDRLIAQKDIQVNKNGFFLGEKHKMASGNSSIYFEDLDNKANSYPVMGEVLDQSLAENQVAGAGVTKPRTRIFGDFQSIPLGGAPVNDTAIGYDGDNFFPFNISGVGITTRIAEAIPATQQLKYEIIVNGISVYVQYLEHNGLAVNEDLTWYFEQPLDIETGTTLRATIYKVSTIDNQEVNEGVLLVCEGDAAETRYQTNVLNRFFEDKEIALQTDVDALLSGSTYKGAYNASTELPSLPTGTDVLGDFYRVSAAGGAYNVGDILVFNGTDYDHIAEENATQSDIKNSGLKIYDIYVKAGYAGAVQDGSVLYPFASIETALATTSDGDSIYLEGSFEIGGEIILPQDQSLYFYGSDDACISFTNYSDGNGSLLYFDGLDNTKELKFKNIKFHNAGGYGLYLKKTAKVTIEDCEFKNNGWNGTAINTIVSKDVSGLLGYDSDAADLQAFYAGSNASNGGAMRIQEATQVLITGNTITNNLRGLRVQDCGINGGGVISRNQSTQNIESGIYIAAGSLGGCQNITTTMNVSAYNANNGLLVIGGINNKFSQNEVNGNWNAGFCAWGSANTTLRDSGLYDNNRSALNGIGNAGDAKASIQINEVYDLLGTSISLNPAFRFIAEILDTQVHYTGLGSNTEKIGFLISSAVGQLLDNDKNIIKVDDVGFIGQDYAIDLSEVDVTNLRLSLGDNSYQSIGMKAVKAPLVGNYSELPFSNHVMQVPELDVVVDTIKQTLSLREGVGGNVINVYAINELAANVVGSSIQIIQASSDKIQLRGLTYGNIYINGVIAGNNLNSANDSLNAAFQMDLVEYKDVLVNEVGINGDDSSGGSLPAIANNWYISYGNLAGTQMTTATIGNNYRAYNPFYNGNALEKGHEFIWTHNPAVDYMIGLWGAAEATQAGDASMAASNWNQGFKYNATNTRFSQIDSSGVSIETSDAFAGFYSMPNGQLALRFGQDNYLYLYEVNSGGYTLIGKSNSTIAGASVMIQWASFNQGSFPVMTERTETWEIVHDADNSENSEWSDGIEQDTILQSRMSVSPEEKVTINLNYFGRGEYIGIGYSGATTEQVGALGLIDSGLFYNQSELLKDLGDWTWNQSASGYYNPVGDHSNVGYWNGNGVDLGLISLRYKSDNSLELWHETNNELIATRTAPLDGSSFNVYFGANEAMPSERIPVLTKYAITADDEVPSISAWWYVESPDGEFYYPLFSTESEANAVDTIEGGAGSSHTHTFIDQTSGVDTWYMPDTSGVHAGTSAPQGGVFGNSINVVWNEIATDADAGYIPTFSNITYNVQEGSAINIQYKAAGMTDTFNITNVPAGYADNGYAIIGTAEDITNGYGQAVQHVLNVTKANNFGSVQGTITINVKADLAGNEFTIIDMEDGTIKFTQDGGITELDFSVVTFNAGSTYKFYMDHNSIESGDGLQVVDVNGDIVLGNDGLSASGNSGDAGAYVQYAIPSDVHPSKFLRFYDNDTSANYADVPMIIAGSTYTASVTGVTNEGPADLSISTKVLDDNWYSINETLSAGERLIFSGPFLMDLHNELQIGSSVIFGVKDGSWANTQDGNNASALGTSGFLGQLSIKFKKTGATGGTINVIRDTAIQGANVFYITSMLNDYSAFIEITGSGNNVRMGVAHSSQNDVLTDVYTNWNVAKSQTGEQGYGLTSIDVMAFYDRASTSAKFDYDNIDWTLLSEIAVPTLVVMDTPWTKALNFSGGNEHAKQVHASASVNALRMGGTAYEVAPNADSSKTADSVNSRPWATAIVFQTPSNTGNQHIWNSGEGAGSGDDNIYLRMAGSNGELYFGWGREGVGYNEYHIGNYGGSYNQSSGQWWGIYIAHNGARFRYDATPANLVDAFDIRLMGTNDVSPVFSTLYNVGNDVNNWTSSGVRMDRAFSGDFTIGGRGGNRSFHGKVASMVVTSLVRDADMPTDAEIKLMITDPVKWVTDYKVGNTYRYAANSSTGLFAINNTSSYFATQVWLMGDGASDSYANGMRNYIRTDDQNYTKLQLNSMVSNDIENVSIAGLS